MSGAFFIPLELEQPAAGAATGTLLAGRGVVSEATWDVIIVGGGPAGLSAALVLGRCCRSVLVCDAGQPRRRATQRLHCFLSRDGTPACEVDSLGREQLRRYATVEWREALVIDAARHGTLFDVSLLGGEAASCRKLLIATGVVNQLPDIAGIEQFYGLCVHHCPECDAWEWRDQPLAAYGRGSKGAALASTLRQWSSDVALFTDGPAELSAAERARLATRSVEIYEERIAALIGVRERLERIELVGGRTVTRRALFFNTAQQQRSALPSRLGFRPTNPRGASGVATHVPGLYIAGEASRDVEIAIDAAADGAKAAFAINKELSAESGFAQPG
jgi:thioredoxin reductase